MNIKQAKDDIKMAVSAYLTKDRFGNFVIPIEKQRPIFLMGGSGNRQNGNYGAGCPGTSNRTGKLLYDSSYKTVGFGTAVYCKEKL